MSDDQWAEAWSKLTTALENAREAGMTEDEIQNCVNDVYAVAEEGVERRPKRPKP